MNEQIDWKDDAFDLFYLLSDRMRGRGLVCSRLHGNGEREDT